MSLSIFVWHQVILAFARYSFIDKFDTWYFLIYIIITGIISYLSYKYIETIKLNSKRSRYIFFTVLSLVTAIALGIYFHAGVVRDVPELGISISNPYVNRNTDYTDQIYRLDNDFTTSKPHILVVGNSFARDFASIIKEYDKNNNLELSYSHKGDINANRASKTDYLFFFGPKDKIPTDLIKNLNPECEIYGISTKTYGKNFGIYYSKRNSPNYFDQTMTTNVLCDSINGEWAQTYEDGHFINLMDVIRKPNGNIPIFTPNNRVISFDCRHLTQDGCKFYAEVIDFKEIFK